MKMAPPRTPLSCGAQYPEYHGTLALHPDMSAFDLVVFETTPSDTATSQNKITFLNFRPEIPEIVHTGTRESYHDPCNRVWHMVTEFTSVGEKDEQIVGGRRM
jgi:hypothetical protein